MKFYFFFFFSIATSTFLTAQPTIQNIQLCTTLNSERSCSESLDTLAANVPAFYVSCTLYNVPDSTEVTFAWYYIAQGQRQLLDKVALNPLAYTGQQAPVYTLNSNLTRTTAAWPKGQYEIVIVTDYDLSKPERKLFYVE